MSKKSNQSTSRRTSSSTSTRQPQSSAFVETARELGLDTDEANAAFERAFGKIAPPKKRTGADSIANEANSVESRNKE